MSDAIRLSSVALDCPDARGLAAFYADITGGRVTFAGDQWATVDGPGGRIDFQTAPGYRPPSWPDEASSMQLHLDFVVEDLAAAEARVLAAGARKYDEQPNSDHCLVFADPAGAPVLPDHLGHRSDVLSGAPLPRSGGGPYCPHSFGTTSRQADCARWRHGWTIRARPVPGGVRWTRTNGCRRRCRHRRPAIPVSRYGVGGACSSAAACSPPVW